MRLRFAVALVGLTTVDAAAQAAPLSKRVIEQWAPAIRLDPAEEYHPIDPLLFIAQSALRLYTGDPERDPVWNHVKERFDPPSLRGTDHIGPPLDHLARYDAVDDGRTRRPKGKKAVESAAVYLDPVPELQLPPFEPDSVPTFYRVEREGKRVLVTYWWFMPFSDSRVGPFGDHQGDWERVTVRIVDGRRDGACFGWHNQSRCVDEDQLEHYRTTFLVFVDKGTHASTHDRAVVSHLGGSTIPTWETRNRLEPLWLQPWHSFAGAWGRPGGTKFGSGPIGPWYQSVVKKN